MNISIKNHRSFLLKNINIDMKTFNFFKETVLKDILDGLVIQKESGEVIDYNERALEILGVTKGQLLGSDSFDPRWKSIKENGDPFPGDEHPPMVALATKKTVKNVKMGVFDPIKNKNKWID